MSIQGQVSLSGEGQALIEAFPIRKSRVQKAAFRDEMCGRLQAMGWQVAVDEGGVLKCRNIVAGNPRTASLILTAHYDTPARLPFPNFIMPRNLLITLLVQLVMAVFIALPPLVLGGLAGWFSGIPLVGSLVALVAALGMMYLILAGPANPHNVNDNTSGVLTLMEAAAALPPALREKTALIFFDNEEKGLLGAYACRKRYGGFTMATLLNFDCVGVGDTLLFVLPRPCRKDMALVERLGAAFQVADGKHLLVDTLPLTIYPSDQAVFPQGIGVCAVTTGRLGRYIGRIHTARDTLLDVENIALLRDGAVRLAAAMDAEREVGVRAQ